MAQQLKVIGNYLSPFVRKVLVCLELKQLEYEIDPSVRCAVFRYCSTARWCSTTPP